MSKAYADKRRILPQTLIRGLLALVLAALAFTAYARMTDRPLSSTPPAAPVVAEAVVTLDSQLAAARVVVRDTGGAVVAEYGQDGGGFITTIHRVILRERGKHKAAADGPIHIQRDANGRIGVFDPSTGFRADLMAYGDDNIAVFAELITKSQR